MTLGFYADGWRACLAGVLADGARDGSWACEDPAQSASLIVAMIDGIGLQAMLHPDEVTPERAGGVGAADRRGSSWRSRCPPRRRLGRARRRAAPPSSCGSRSAGATSTPAAPCTPPPSSPTWRRRAAAGSRTGSAGAPTVLARVAIDLRAPLRAEAGEVVVRCALRRAGPRRA